MKIPTPDFKNFFNTASWTAGVSVALGASLLIASYFGWATKDSEGWLITLLGVAVKALTDLTITIIEVAFGLYVAFFAYWADEDKAYKSAKWMLMKCFLWLSIFPCAYSIAMLGVAFVQWSSLAITITVMCYANAFILALLLPNQSLNERAND